MKVSIKKSALKRIIKESIDNAYSNQSQENDEIQYPDEVYEIGKEIYNLNYRLKLICGDVRFKDDEMYKNLKSIQEQLNAVCGDLAFYQIADYQL